MTNSLTWLRLLILFCSGAVLWGGFELFRTDTARSLAMATACVETNRSSLAEAARLSALSDIPAAVGSLSRMNQCPAPRLHPWVLLVGGTLGLLLAALAATMVRRIAALEAAQVAAPVALGRPAATRILIDKLAENDPVVRVVTEEMRSQGLNISPDVARHIAEMRAPRA